jgi:biopolymer transport protein TolR
LRSSASAGAGFRDRAGNSGTALVSNRAWEYYWRRAQQGRYQHDAPMIDVLLVLIIIFMVITPMTPSGLRTLLPQPPANQAEQVPAKEIVVTVEWDGTVLLNVERVELDTLPDRLKRIFQSLGDHVIFVRGDKELVFRQIAEVIDIAKGAGLQRVALITN